LRTGHCCCLVFFDKDRYCNTDWKCSTDWKLQSLHLLVLFFSTKADTAILTVNFNLATFWCYSELPSDTYLMTVQQMRSIFFTGAYHG
jgi:hypothetical protein